MELQVLTHYLVNFTPPTSATVLSRAGLESREIGEALFHDLLAWLSGLNLILVP